MSTQEQFAAWHKERFGWDYAELGGDDYNLLACWQAAEAASIERCAKVCDATAKELLAPSNEEAVFGAASCRDDIRALLKSDGGEGAEQTTKEQR